nr:hypothetical protein GCM10020093_019500 [Planobispora longispora]
MPADAYPHEAGPGGDASFAQRDYVHGRPWGYEPPERPEPPEPPAETGSPGVVALLTTAGDEREHWLAAGQGLQRALLFASAYGVRATFHTQALELDQLREFIRGRLCSGSIRRCSCGWASLRRRPGACGGRSPRSSTSGRKIPDARGVARPRDSRR